jgi:hypothetical protein
MSLEDFAEAKGLIVLTALDTVSQAQSDNASAATPANRAAPDARMLRSIPIIDRMAL